MGNNKEQFENSVNRRQFVKKAAIAGAAAAGAIAGAKNTCALTYDENGKVVDWWCIDKILDDSDPTVWQYRWKNCRTGQTWIGWDLPNRKIGDCSNPSAPSCVQGGVIDRWQRASFNGKQYLMSPALDRSTIGFIRANIHRLAHQD